jgi:hypothetical protein
LKGAKILKYFGYLTVRRTECTARRADDLVRQQIFNAIEQPLVAKVTIKIELIPPTGGTRDRAVPITDKTVFLLADTNWQQRCRNLKVSMENLDSLEIS